MYSVAIPSARMYLDGELLHYMSLMNAKMREVDCLLAIFALTDFQCDSFGFCIVSIVTLFYERSVLENCDDFRERVAF